MTNVFGNKDFNSADGMLTAVWGPGLWHTLHTMSFNYPIHPTHTQKLDYFNYLKSLQKVLPCKYCRENYEKNIMSAGFNTGIFDNRMKFSKFIYDLHNEVNIMLGKKKFLTFDKVRVRYEHFRSRCLEKDKGKRAGYEDGCTDPLYGLKSKCIIKIVPKDKKESTFQIDPKCKLERLCRKSDKTFVSLN